MKAVRPHPTLYAQGDILIEKIDDITTDHKTRVANDPDGAVVLARGERSGHRHAIHGGVAVMHHKGSLARDILSELYLGHVVVTGATAVVSHDEHADIVLPRGTYRIRRQRQHTASEKRRSRLVAD